MNHQNNQVDTSSPTHMRASAAELKAFLQSIKGKGPREVLGEIAQSQLGWALIQATLGCIVLMAVFTVGPYLLSSPASEKDKVAETKPDETDNKDKAAKVEPKPTDGSKAEEKDKATTTVEAKKDAPLSKDAEQKLGLDTKKTDPKVNPLDPKIDDLFKDIDKK